MNKFLDIDQEFSFEKEKATAKSFSQRFQWEMMSNWVGASCYLALVMAFSFTGLYSFMDRFFIASICACFAYLPSHEAQHGNFSRGDAKMRWLDSLVGHITLVTLHLPYELLRVTHMKHHAYTNNPEKDPDYLNAHAGSLLQTIKRSADGSNTADYEKYLDIFESDKAFVNSFQKAIPIALMYRACLMSLVIIFPLETLLLWWVPAKIGNVVCGNVFFLLSSHWDIGRAI